MPTEEFRLLVEAGHETRHIEFKQPFRWNDDNSVYLREKVIKAILGFSNTKDGGNIVIGITEDFDHHPQLVGLSGEEIQSFSYESIKGQIDSFGTSIISFEIKEAEDKNKHFIVINVSDFEELPIICKKDSQTKDVMRRGDIYCRLLSGNISTDKATEKEMREIIEMATDKGDRKLNARGRICCPFIGAYPSMDKGDRDAQKVEDFFNQQIKDLK